MPRAMGGGAARMHREGIDPTKAGGTRGGSAVGSSRSLPDLQQRSALRASNTRISSRRRALCIRSRRRFTDLAQPRINGAQRRGSSASR
eukprot:11034901-Alexandrium_andersonii.AAC.1